MPDRANATDGDPMIQVVEPMVPYKCCQGWLKSLGVIYTLRRAAMMTWRNLKLCNLIAQELAANQLRMQMSWSFLKMEGDRGWSKLDLGQQETSKEYSPSWRLKSRWIAQVEIIKDIITALPATECIRNYMKDQNYEGTIAPSTNAINKGQVDTQLGNINIKEQKE